MTHTDGPAAAPVTRPAAAALAVRLAGRDPLLMGILNVTPDSFSDGGRFDDVGRARSHAIAMAADGADLLDIGGESTRPGHRAVTLEDERARVLPILDALAGTVSLPLSIDTTKAALAREALAHGACVVNDQWGFQGDPAMAGVVAEAGAVAVLMHNRSVVDPDLAIADDLARFFERSLHTAARAGVPPAHLVLDPGIGFGKSPAQQIEALRAVPGLRRRFGLPVLVGASRKSFLGRITGAPVEAREPATLAAHLFAWRSGATLFRVHDVSFHRTAFAVELALAGAPPC